MFNRKFFCILIVVISCMVFIIPVSACLHIFNPDPVSSIEWELNTSGIRHEMGYDIHGTCDGGYILIGTIGTSDPGSWRNSGSTGILVRKLDAGHNVSWERIIGGSGRSEGRKIRETNDGGYLVVGMSMSDDWDFKASNHGGWDVVAGKIDSAGNLEWVRNFGGSSDDFGENIRLTKDGAIIIGRTFSNDGDVSTRANYALETKKEVPQTQTPKRTFNKTQIFTANNTESDLLAYLLDDTLRENQTGQSDVWVMEIDPLGKILWQQRYGGSNDDYGYDIIPLDDGGYYFTGVTFSNDGDIDGKNFGKDTGTSDGWVVRLKPDNSIDWQGCRGGSKNEGFFNLEPVQYPSAGSGCIVEINYSSVYSQRNGYTLAGFAESRDGAVFPRPTNNHESYDGWIVKANLSLVKEWSRCVGGTGFDVITSSKQTNRGKFVFSGFTMSTDGDIRRTVPSGTGPVPVIGLFNLGDVTFDWMIFPGDGKTGILNSVEILPDGRYLTVGWTKPGNPSGMNDLYIAHLTAPQQPIILTPTTTTVQKSETIGIPQDYDTLESLESPQVPPPSPAAAILALTPIAAAGCAALAVALARNRK